MTPDSKRFQRLRCALRDWSDAILGSYSSILFSNRRWVGAILLLSTFNNPIAGWTGLAGVLVSLGFARLMGFPMESWRRGHLSFNAMFAALGVAFLLQFTGRTFALYAVLVVISAVFSVLLTVSLGEVFRYYLRLPAMSWPFVLVTLAVCLVVCFWTGHPLAPPPPRLLWSDPAGFPPALTVFFHSLGNIFFQNNVVAGILVAVALTIESRIALFLAIMGVAFGAWLLGVFGLGSSSVGFAQIGFNLILTAIVLGGIFTVPSLTAYLYALVGVALCAITGLALLTALAGFAIPPLAIPFNFCTLLGLYALRWRGRLNHPILVNHAPGSPEENLNLHLNRLQRYGRGKRVPFYLPFNGTWTVTQEPNSEPTHQPPWQHAWDFEVTGPDGRTFRDLGSEPKDYYAYDAPVTAPADGTVAAAVDRVPDNPIGQMDTAKNWGNLIVTYHGPGIYSVLAHLRAGTLKVKAGDVVKHGQIVAHCGNSGRSAVPHLHFHVQTTAWVGSPTLPIEFVRYVEETPQGPSFQNNGTPHKGVRLHDFAGDIAIGNILRLNAGEATHLVLQVGARETDETWRVGVDLLGNFYIDSSLRARLYYYVWEGVFTAVDFQGSRQTALYALFLAASRLPYQSQNGFAWTDELCSRFILRGPAAWLANLLRPFGETVPVKSHARMLTETDPANGGAHWAIETRVRTGGHAWFTARLSFSPSRGILTLRLANRRGTILEARRTERTEEDATKV